MVYGLLFMVGVGRFSSWFGVDIIKKRSKDSGSAVSLLLCISRRGKHLPYRRNINIVELL
jgi:hypothetical protein